MNDITVDRQTLKALGAETRVNILKELSRRKMTQAELAVKLGLSQASVNEHVRNLEQVGLVAQIDSQGRKWKYYELTPKGAAIVGGP